MTDTMVDSAIRELDRAGDRIRCTELEAFLLGLGFFFKNKRTPNHKVYFHDGLPNFHSASFNCEHGKDPAVKASYVQRVKRELLLHKDDLNKYLNEREKK